MRRKCYLLGTRNSCSLASSILDSLLTANKMTVYIITLLAFLLARANAGMDDSSVEASTGCPAGVSKVQCLLNPCRNANCAKFPSATCIPNYCGSCGKDFYHNDKKVNCDSGCSAGVSKVKCLVNPCRNANCAKFPSATCKPNYCGSCGKDFYHNDKKVNCDSGEMATIKGTITFMMAPGLLPSGSCMRLRVEDVTRQDVTSGIVHEKIIKLSNQKIEKTYKYEMQFQKPSPDEYSKSYNLDIVLNHGWCSENTDSSVRVGDCMDTRTRRVKFTSEKNVYVMNVMLKHYKKN